MAKGRGRGKTKVGKIYIFSNLMAILILFSDSPDKEFEEDGKHDE
jgi:hypothetical protein